MKRVELYARVRHAVRIEGISERAAAEPDTTVVKNLLDELRRETLCRARYGLHSSSDTSNLVERALLTAYAKLAFTAKAACH